jgi:hypothetical protein
MVSGRLAEWPVLAAAFRAVEEPADPCMGAAEMRARARAILEHPRP